MKSKKLPVKRELLNKRINTAELLSNIAQQKIGWNFHSVETQSKYYGWTFKKLAVYIKKLVINFENKTISEIERAGGNNHSHFWNDEDLKKLDPELQKILLQKFGEQAQIFQFHLSSKVRIWGAVEGNIFHIACLDEEHKGYKVNKKHT